MKKLIVLLSMVFALGSALDSTAQKTRYYYYPGTNVYYNTVTGDYWYMDPSNATWMSVKALPTTIVVDTTDRYSIYYTGTDIYKQNAEHVKKYKEKKNGTVKQKPK